MRKRRRSLIGVVLLAAMTVSFVETAAASMCPPMPDAGAAANMGAMSGMQMAGIQMVGMQTHDRSARDAAPERDDDRPQEQCPFAPAGSARGCAAASLPAQTLQFIAVPSRAVQELTPTGIEPHLFLVSVPFHPPKS